MENVFENVKNIKIWKTDSSMLELIPDKVIGKVIKGILNNTLYEGNLSKQEKMIYNILYRNAELGLSSTGRSRLSRENSKLTPTNKEKKTSPIDSDTPKDRETLESNIMDFINNGLKY